MLILGIETSCDDTGIAIVKVSGKKRPIFNILSNVVSSQIKTHAPFGGVVPNLAAREHLKNIAPCLKTAFKEARIKPKNIDLIAVTIGPGLIPSLLIGVNFAKALAYIWQKPIVGVNHIEGHIIAALATINSKLQAPISQQISNFQKPISQTRFPTIGLIVSGGHTQLVLIKKLGDYKILGETRDDAAGECFDKVAKLLRLGYPGGPAIAKEAAKVNFQFSSFNFKLPRPMINQKNYDFSFSGLKTAVLYLLNDIKQKYPIFSECTENGINIIPEICFETQQAIIDVLIEKTIRAVKEYKAKTIILSGGVAANEELRKQLSAKSQLLKVSFLVPPKNLCMDNGAMICLAGYFNYKSGAKTDWKKIKADANLRI